MASTWKYFLGGFDSRTYFRSDEQARARATGFKFFNIFRYDFFFGYGIERNEAQHFHQLKFCNSQSSARQSDLCWIFACRCDNRMSKLTNNCQLSLIDSSLSTSNLQTKNLVKTTRIGTPLRCQFAQDGNYDWKSNCRDLSFAYRSIFDFAHLLCFAIDNDQNTIILRANTRHARFVCWRNSCRWNGSRAKRNKFQIAAVASMTTAAANAIACDPLTTSRVHGYVSHESIVCAQKSHRRLVHHLFAFD